MSTDIKSESDPTPPIALVGGKGCGKTLHISEAIKLYSDKTGEIKLGALSPSVPVAYIRPVSERRIAIKVQAQKDMEERLKKFEERKMADFVEWTHSNYPSELHLWADCDGEEQILERIGTLAKQAGYVSKWEGSNRLRPLLILSIAKE